MNMTKKPEPTFFAFAFGPATAVRRWSEPTAVFPTFASCVQRIANRCIEQRMPATVYGFVGQPSRANRGQDVRVEIDACGDRIERMARKEAGR